MKNTENKRKRIRVAFNSQVNIVFETVDIILNTRMKNISMNGIFVETEKTVPLNTPCHIEVIVTAPHSRLTIETMGFVSRIDPTGLGIKFKYDMEWFAFFSIFEHYGKKYNESLTTDN
jgi:hypothetical protein